MTTFTTEDRSNVMEKLTPATEVAGHAQLLREALDLL